jgi:hypothetical protein
MSRQRAQQSILDMAGRAGAIPVLSAILDGLTETALQRLAGKLALRFEDPAQEVLEHLQRIPGYSDAQRQKAIADCLAVAPKLTSQQLLPAALSLLAERHDR